MRQERQRPIPGEGLSLWLGGIAGLILGPYCLVWAYYLLVMVPRGIDMQRLDSGSLISLRQIISILTAPFGAILGAIGARYWWCRHARRRE